MPEEGSPGRESRRRQKTHGEAGTPARVKAVSPEVVRIEIRVRQTNRVGMAAVENNISQRNRVVARDAATFAHVRNGVKS